MEGRCETPLSSWKRIQALRRRAFFLSPAKSGSASAALSPACVRGLVWRDVAGSSPGRAGSSTRGRGDRARRLSARSLLPPGAASTDRLRSRGRALLGAKLARLVGDLGDSALYLGRLCRQTGES